MCLGYGKKVRRKEAQDSAEAAPRRAVSMRAMETTREILAEIFGARPDEVEEMIQRGQEERCWGEEVRECY